MCPRILIVDDEAGLVEMLQDVLGLLGCEALAATVLHDGLALALREDLDLVLLDNHFPEGHADAIIPPLLAAKPDLPIIIVTANESDVHVKRALELGARDVLGKPFGLDELLTAMRRYCPAMPERRSRVA